MLRYYLWLGLRSLRRNPALTVLMVLSIGLGIGASMTTLTVLRLLAGDPLPQRSAVLFHPQLDPQNSDGFREGDEPPDQLTRYDAETLLAEARGDRQAMMTGGNVPVLPQREGLDPFYADARYTSADFFAMFAVPLRYGSGWTAAEDAAEARVAVISRELNDKLHGGDNSVGRMLRIGDHDLRIVGVLDHWRPSPHFYDLNTGSYTEAEQVFLPFSTAQALKLSRSGAMNCWDDAAGEETEPGAPCVWIQYWVELGTPQKAAAYRDYLARYSEVQRAAGRYQRPPNVRLRGLMEWLDYNRVVPSDARLQTWLALGFLLVCMINTVGLLLAKFLRRSGEIAVRRSLGASRRAVFTQFLVESAMVGAAGGLLGLLLAMAGLWAVRQQPADYVELAQLDGPMLLATLVLALVASLAAGLLPAWRACQIAPALQLKSQ